MEIRHFIVKLIAPKLYHSVVGFSEKRPMIDALPRDRPLTGVEIGVMRGLNSIRILRKLKIKKLFLVDPYIEYVDSVGAFYDNPQDNFNEAKFRLRKYRDKIQFIIKTSSSAKEDIPDELDFVYVDGNHTYEFVKQDIEDYYPKVKHGGVIGGHDFSTQFFGVIKAVTEFAIENSLDLHAKHLDWWIVKP
jgi:hypothetical protein